MHVYIGCSWVLIWMFEGLLLPVRRGDSEVVEAPETPVPEPFQPSQHRAAKAQLERVCQGPRAAEFPELAAAYKSGSKKEQREILEKFVNSGRDLGAIEATVKATREMIHAEKAGRVQMTLKDMVDANFSEFLVCTGLASIECLCFFLISFIWPSIRGRKFNRSCLEEASLIRTALWIKTHTSTGSQRKRRKIFVTSLL